MQSRIEGSRKHHRVTDVGLPCVATSLIPVRYSVMGAGCAVHTEAACAGVTCMSSAERVDLDVFSVERPKLKTWEGEIDVCKSA